MAKRAAWPMHVAEGTKNVGTARVREDMSVGRDSQQRALAKKFGTQPNSEFDDIASCSEPVKSLAPAARKTAAPREAAKKALQALGRLKAGAMNATERRYAAHLEQRKHAGDIVWFRFEGMKFRLADNTFYTPDFAVMLASGELECHEVKGHWQDDARVKVKVVADQYPLRFIAVTANAKKSGGGWAVEEF
ncbi:gp8 [Burkholderia sp. YI23]|nr:gp8 [Burkholderia sp. YI23]